MNITHTAWGAPALEALRALVAEAQRDDSLAPVTVIVRDNIAGLTVRRALARGVDGRLGVAAITTVTLPRLAELELARAGKTSTPVTTATLTMAWRAELAREPLSLARVAEHPSTVRALVRAHRELRRVDAANLQALAGQSELLADVVALHRRVLARLGEERRDEAALVEAASILDGGGRHLGRIIDFLPARRTPAEQRFVTQLTRGADAHGIFAGEAEVMASEVLHASDADEEVRAVTRQALQALATHPGPRLAILYTARSPYASLLHDRFTEAGISFNGHGVRPLRDRATADAFLTLLALDGADLRRRELFDWLGRAPIRLAAADRMTPPRSAWERISREAGVIGEDHWTTRLDAFVRTKRAEREELASDPDASEGSIRHREMSIDQAEGLRLFVAELRDQLAAATRVQTWAELGTWALNALHRYLGPSHELHNLREDEQRAVIAIEQTLRSLGDLDGALGGGVTPRPDALRDIVEADLEARMPRVGRFGEGVFVGHVSSAASLDVARVWVVGLSEDLYPGRLNPDPLLPERARAASGGALPTVSERVDDLRLALAAALHAAPVSTASFARGDLRRSTERLPSRWLMPTIRALAGLPTLPATKWDDAESALTGLSSNWSETRTAELPATEQELRLRRLAAGDELGDPVLSDAATLVDARRSVAFTRFDGNLAGVADLPDLTNGHTLVSTTALEAYAKCPHAYFVERMLGVKPLEQPEESVTIAPMHVGNLIHETMDDLTREEAQRLPDYGGPWTPEQRARLRELANARADDYEARGLTGHPRLWATDRASILADLDAMLDDDDAFRAAESARVLASELHFGMRGIGPVHVQVASGSVGLRGSADRVDQRADGSLVVTDIKSGSSRGFADIERGDPLVAGTKLQLPAYALAAKARYGEQPVTAQYWFVRKDRGRRIAVPLDEELSSRYRDILDTLADGIRSGIFPAKPPEKDDYLFVTCPWCNPDGLGYGSLRDGYARKNTDAAMRRLLGVIDPAVVSQAGTAGAEEGSGR
ncbi:PD-(D/E)XK nuclease family protein [Microbacterium sp. ProA8]|uniref:PD-(D/E)XK nuclease family protein n=1 Tax=Microbacterium chionoecetis TaxID=3153754 RepID=UPI003267F327